MLAPMARSAKTKPRRRLDAAVAREVILDAAEKRLVVVGPSGIRLQEVAADAGLSHPTVLHHFGSREHLVTAVIARALHAINASLVEAIQKSSGDGEQLEALLQGVANALENTGHARVMLWLLLEGHRIEEKETNLGGVIDAIHSLRLSRRHYAKPPKREDTARAIALAAIALIGGNVMGPTLFENAGLGSDRKAGVHFRSWLARLLLDHLDGDGF
jgi:AcrR family transcriptional regulator